MLFIVRCLVFPLVKKANTVDSVGHLWDSFNFCIACLITREHLGWSLLVKPSLQAVLLLWFHMKWGGIVVKFVIWVCARRWVLFVIIHVSTSLRYILVVLTSIIPFLYFYFDNIHSITLGPWSTHSTISILLSVIVLSACRRYAISFLLKVLGMLHIWYRILLHFL